VPSVLDNPPPPPSQVGSPGPPPQASLQGLAGEQQGQQGGQDQSIQIVTQHLMEAEQALQAAARVKPELSAILDKFVSEVKPQAGQILFGAGQPNAGSGGSPPVGISPLMASGMGGGMNMRP
jgi:hypothetical protein